MHWKRWAFGFPPYGPEWWGGAGAWTGRRGGWGRFFAPGELRLALLSLLVAGPKHGYELMKILETRSGGMYKASAGAVYPTLQQLEDEGMVTSQQVESKRVYQITDAGREEVQRNSVAIDELWKRTDAPNESQFFSAAPHAAAMAAPAMHLMKAAFQAVVRSDGDPDRMAKIYEVLDKARRDLDGLK